MKSFFKYIGVIFSLLFIFFIIKYLYEPKTYSNTELSKLIDLKNVKKIEFINNNDIISIEKNDKEWHITKPFNWKALTNEIENILSNLEKSKLYGPLTENEKNYSKFNITEISFKITIHSTKIFSFLIGKEASFNSIYIKPENKKGIYEMSGISTYEIKKDLNDLLDKNIINLNDNEIEKITIKYGNKENILNKKENDWDSEKSKNIYEKLKNIRFNSIDKASRKLNPEIIISITTRSKTLLYEVVKEKNNYHIIINDLILKLDEDESKKISEIKDIFKK